MIFFDFIKNTIFKKTKKTDKPFFVDTDYLLQFFDGDKMDNKGRYITDYIQFNSEQMEQFHDFIQWAFPTSKPSKYVKDAPLLRNGFAARFQCDCKALENYCLMCRRYLNHIGLNCNGIKCKNCNIIIENDDRKVEFWQIPSHNYLRITRLLQSLNEVGNNLCSKKIYETLLLKKEREKALVWEEALEYWEKTQNEQS